MKKRKNNHFGIIIVLFIILLLIAIGLFIARFYLGDDLAKSDELLILDPVSFTLNSSDSDKPHNVDMCFSLEGDESEIKDIDKNTVNNLILEALSNADYNLLVGKDGSKYAKKLVLEKLNSVYPDKNIENIYISDFRNDLKPVENYDSESKDGVNEGMKALFNGLK